MRGSSPRMTTEWIKSTGNRYRSVRHHASFSAFFAALVNFLMMRSRLSFEM